jgi:DNA-binding NtrC family response regulator
MGSNAIAIVGDERSNNLLEGLFRLGKVPVIRRTVQDVLWSLRHQNVAAVLIDGVGTDEDILEVVLNIRDVDPHVPVVLMLAPGTDLQGEWVERVPDVHLTERQTPPSRPYLEKLLRKALQGESGTKSTQAEHPDSGAESAESG